MMCGDIRADTLTSCSADTRSLAALSSVCYFGVCLNPVYSSLVSLVVNLGS